jgi:endonuclease/exonuclease/phosphatase family metal-dependent hydrolase
MPEKFGIIALLSLVTPALIIINLVFVIFWIIIGFKKQVILSFFVLLLSLLFIPKLYKFNNEKDSASIDHLRIMTYNVRKFNVFNWLKIKNIDAEIKELITNEDPDILMLQEFRNIDNFKLNFPYFYNHIANKNVQSGLAIYSKYPVINEGAVGFNRSGKDAIYVDIVKENDTLRVYNFRLNSTGVVPDEDFFGHKDSEKLIKRLRKSFKTHQKQVDTLTSHVKNCPYKVILAGDLNNTAYSWDYKNIKNEMKDTFLEAGKGFGKTYEFKKFPLRIDYIFVDENIKVIGHKNLKQQFSDHYPIVATLEL